MLAPAGLVLEAAFFGFEVVALAALGAAVARAGMANVLRMLRERAD